MSTLYREYRPQKFSEILGQNHIKVTLQNEIMATRPAGAYLFCGPRAVGKTTMARILAKTVNCEKRPDNQAEPCNECPSCKSILNGSHLEVVEIDAASNTGVDNVRDNIISFCRLAPTSAKYKIFIIDEVHMLSISAFNALLKIIEEPPAYVIFVLCTTEIQKVPATIISRCERFDFRRISITDIVKKLNHIAKQEKIEIAEEILEAIARRSSGHLRDAESLLGQIFSLGDKKISAEQAELVMPHYSSQEAINLLSYLQKKDAAKGITLVNNLVESGTNMKFFVGENISLLRKIMLSKLSPELETSLGLDWGEELEKNLAPVASSLSLEQTIIITKRLIEVLADNRSPLIPQLPLEIAIGELCFGLTQGEITSPPNTSISQIKPVVKPITKEVPLTPTPTKTPSTNTLSAAINISDDEILSKWPELLIKIKKHNHSLSFVLQNCIPLGMKAGVLQLAFKYKFHQDRVNDQNIKNIVESVLQEVYGPGLTFASCLDEKLSLSREEADGEPVASVPEVTPPVTGLMSDLLKTFGGEVVN